MQCYPTANKSKSISNTLPKDIVDDYFDEDTSDIARLIPDVSFFDEESNTLKLFEVEVSNPISNRKLSLYSQLENFLAGICKVEFYSVSRYGTPERFYIKGSFLNDTNYAVNTSQYNQWEKESNFA